MLKRSIIGWPLLICSLLAAVCFLFMKVLPSAVLQVVPFFFWLAAMLFYVHYFKGRKAWLLMLFTAIGFALVYLLSY